MAGPLSGIGGQQTQIPFSNTFQPGRTETRVEREERTPKSDQVQRREFQAAQSQETESRSRDLRSLVREDSNDNSRSRSRGEIVDISV